MKGCSWRCDRGLALASNPIRSLGGAERSPLRRCACGEAPLALYNVSTPSGMITIRAVPTKTPMPIVEIRRSRDGEREKESGKEPARKDLRLISSCVFQQTGVLTQWPSTCSA